MGSHEGTHLRLRSLRHSHLPSFQATLRPLVHPVCPRVLAGRLPRILWPLILTCWGTPQRTSPCLRCLGGLQGGRPVVAAQTRAAGRQLLMPGGNGMTGPARLKRVGRVAGQTGGRGQTRSPQKAFWPQPQTFCARGRLTRRGDKHRAPSASRAAPHTRRVAQGLGAVRRRRAAAGGGP